MAILPFAPRPKRQEPPVPSAAEVVLALHQLLQKHQFAGREDIHAWQTGSKQAPSYVVVVGIDVAVVLEQVLAPVLRSRSQMGATHWVLYPADVTAIWAAAS